MTVFAGATMTKIAAGQPAPSPGFAHGTVRTFVEVVTYATQTTSDTINVAFLPKGATILACDLTTDTSSGSATIAIGITGTTTKYKTAAAFTTLQTVTRCVAGAALAYGSAPLTADETVFITLAAASAPASGTLSVVFYYVTN